jgi:hypothetical protein
VEFNEQICQTRDRRKNLIPCSARNLEKDASLKQLIALAECRASAHWVEQLVANLGFLRQRQSTCHTSLQSSHFANAFFRPSLRSDSNPSEETVMASEAEKVLGGAVGGFCGLKGSATVGAVIGTFLCPGAGTLIGAKLGAIAGGALGARSGYNGPNSAARSLQRAQFSSLHHKS